MLSFLFITHLELIVWQLTSHSVFIFFFSYTYKVELSGSQTTNFLSFESRWHTKGWNWRWRRVKRGVRDKNQSDKSRFCRLKKKNFLLFYLYSILIPLKLYILSLSLTYSRKSHEKHFFFGKINFNSFSCSLQSRGWLKKLLRKLLRYFSRENVHNTEMLIRTK